MSGPDIPALLTAAEVARVYRRSTRTLRTWVKRRLLQPVRIGRAVYFRAEDVIKLAGGKSTSSRAENAE